MTQIQYDVLLTKFVEMENKVQYMQEVLNTLVFTIKELCGKTVVITDIADVMSKMKVDIEALKDEVRM